MAHITPAARRSATIAVAREGTDHLGPVEVALVAGVVVIIAAILVMPARLQGPSDPPSTRPVRVRQGDSLWSLAQAHAVTGLGASETASLIRELNGLDGSGLAVGQVVLVPAEDAGSGVALAGP